MQGKYAILIALIALIITGATGCLPLEMLEGSLTAPAVVHQFLRGWEQFNRSDLYDSISPDGLWDEIYMDGAYEGSQYYTRNGAVDFYGDPFNWPWNDYAECRFSTGTVTLTGKKAEVQALIETIDYDGTPSSYAHLQFTVELRSTRWVITGIRWVY